MIEPTGFTGSSALESGKGGMEKAAGSDLIRMSRDKVALGAEKSPECPDPVKSGVLGNVTAASQKAEPETGAVAETAADTLKAGLKETLDGERQVNPLRAVANAVGGTVGPMVNAGRKLVSRVVYDARFWVKDVENKISAHAGEALHLIDSGNKNLMNILPDMVPGQVRYRDPLTAASTRAAQSTGEMERKYDGYDSSRNIFALYTEEGKKDEKYSFQVEMANLRSGAEYGHLDVYMGINWGDGKGNTEAPFGLKTDSARPWKMAVKIDNMHMKEMIDKDGRKLKTKPENVFFSNTFSSVQFQLDKDVLREAGWKDGQPLQLQVMTAEDHKSGVSDQLNARTNASDDSMGKIFRWEGKNIYFIMTDRFYNADKTNDQDTDPSDPERFHGGDWKGITEKLDYLQDMGVNSIWISAPYENDRDFFGKDGYHGYWPHDFSKPEPHFGTKEQMKNLVEEAHKRGIKVILDVVVNHTGYNAPLAGDPANKDWFHREKAAAVDQWGIENSSIYGLPDFDQDKPEVSKFIIDSHKKWLEDTGVDGFRVDAVRHVPQDFLREFDAEMHRESKNFFTVGECFWTSPNYLAGYQNRTTDSAFDFPVAFAIRSAFAHKDQSMWQWMGEIKELFSQNPIEAMQKIFHPGNNMHRISDAVKGDKFYDNPRKMSVMLDNHDMVRFLTDCGGDKGQLKQAMACLYAFRGMPAVYYGTEVGMEGGHGHNRKDMEWGKNPDLQAEFTRLSKARNNSTALQTGNQKELFSDNTGYVLSRMRPDEEVVCAFNSSKKDRTLTFRLDPASPMKNGDELKDMLSGYKVKVQGRKLQVDVPAGGYLYMQWKK